MSSGHSALLLMFWYSHLLMLYTSPILLSLSHLSALIMTLSYSRIFSGSILPTERRTNIALYLKTSAN